MDQEHITNSQGLDKLPADLRLEYDVLLSEQREQIRPATGLTVLHQVLLERFIFIYVALKHLERDFENLDQQRYNQLTSIWQSIGRDLLSKYLEIYEQSAPEELFVDKVLHVVVEEVKDRETLDRIRARFATLAKE